MKVLAGVAQVVAAVAYPVAVWWGLTHLGPRAVGLLVIAVLVPSLALRFRSAPREELARVLRVPLLVLAVLVCGAILDDARFVKAMPVLINGVLLAEFGASLRAGRVPMIERFARLQESRRKPGVAPDALLSEGQKAHCRQTTVVWCAFFVLNAAVAAALALWADTFTWAAYTGGVAYALMGALVGAEVAVRYARFGRAAVFGA